MLKITEEIEGAIGIVIADNGIGFKISGEDAIKPFVTTKTSGLGLGLNIVSEIMLAQNGSIVFPENGDIDLFRGKILKVEVPVIPILPVLQVNFDLDFVVKANFAIALNADASVLQATQVGAFGDTRNGNIGAIQHKLPGGDQYSIEVSADI